MSEAPQPLTPEEIKQVLNGKVVIKGNILFSTIVYTPSALSRSGRGVRKINVDLPEKKEVWIYTDSRDGMMYDVVPDWNTQFIKPLN